jgi:hypothetical protein
MGENVVAVEATDQSGEALETVDLRRAVPKQSSKRAAPEQGMSDRPSEESPGAL